MKNYLFPIVVGVMIALGVNTSRGENKVTERAITVKELPQPARQLLESYFQGAAVVECVQSRLWDEYEVKLAGGYELDFDEKGHWTVIEAEEKPLPEKLLTLLPVASVKYLREHYPNAKVEELKQKRSGYKVSLAHPDVELYFLKSGEFLRQSD